MFLEMKKGEVSFNKMGKQGQLGILSAVFGLFIFLIFWATAGGNLVKTFGENEILKHSYTGTFAFIFANLNFFIFIGLIVGIVVIMSVRQ